MSDLLLSLREAATILETETCHELELLFGERPLEPEQLSPAAAHAFGLIEGAAIALNVTALELLDELNTS
jgi:hypothetical protein